jgi:hypothetical protein
MPDGAFSSLMFEMSSSGHDHGHVVAIAKVNAILVLDRTTGLNHRPYTFLKGYFNAVGKGKKGIAGHDSALNIKIKSAGLVGGLAHRINSRTLTGA